MWMSRYRGVWVVSLSPDGGAPADSPSGPWRVACFLNDSAAGRLCSLRWLRMTHTMALEIWGGYSCGSPAVMSTVGFIVRLGHEGFPSQFVRMATASSSSCAAGASTEDGWWRQAVCRITSCTFGPQSILSQCYSADRNQQFKAKLKLSLLGPQYGWFLSYLLQITLILRVLSFVSLQLYLQKLNKWNRNQTLTWSLSFVCFYIIILICNSMIWQQMGIFSTCGTCNTDSRYPEMIIIIFFFFTFLKSKQNRAKFP